MAHGPQPHERAARPWGMEAEGWDETTQGSPGMGGEKEVKPQQRSPAMVMFREVSCQLIPLLALQE